MTDDKDGGKTVIRPMPGGAFGGGAARAWWCFAALQGQM